MVSIYKRDDRGDKRSLAVEGAMDFDTAGSLRRRSRPLFADAPKRIEIDLSAVSSANSAGFVLLLEWLRWAKRTQREVTFKSVPDKLKRYADQFGLSGLLHIETDRVAHG
jgi:phospholipid transport system transporter-binding protein